MSAMQLFVGAELTGTLSMLVIPLLMLVLLYFLMIRPQKKQEKKLKEQRDSMKVGDQVVSIGGIKGRVVNIKEDEVTIASSVASSLITFRKDAIGQVLKAESEGEEKSE